jgi:hypothetical protein
VAAKGIELASAYISLNVSTENVGKQVKTAFEDAAKYAKSSGTKMGSDMGSAIRDQLANSGVVRKALGDTTKGAGQQSAKKFFEEFHTTSQRVGAVTGLVIGKTIGLGIRGGLAAADFAGNMFDRLKTSGVNMAKNVGSMIGRTLAMSVRGAIGALGLGGAGIIAGTLFSGFERLKGIDQATFKLKALGHSVQETQQIMDSALESVKGTAYSLSDAADIAASAVAAGVEPGKKLAQYLSDIADVAAVSGDELSSVGSVMNNITTLNAAYNDSLQILAQKGLPVYNWLSEQLHTTTADVKQLASEGKISAQTFQQAVETHIAGAAKSMGDSLAGSIENAKTALARLGADFLGSIFGNDKGPVGGATSAVDAITGKLDELDGWVKTHKQDIKEFFTSAKDAATEVINAVRGVSGFLKEHPGLIKATVVAFGAWKAIEGVSALITSLQAISTLLRVTLPASAAVGGAGMAAGLSPLLKFLPLFAVGGIPDTKPATDLGLPDITAPLNPFGGQGPGPYAQAQRHGRDITSGLPTPGQNPMSGAPSIAPTDGGGGADVTNSFGPPGGGGRGLLNLDGQLLARIPPGQYVSKPGVGDLTQGIGDCTSAIEDLINIIDGQSTAGRSMSTGNAAQWLAARGFLPGTMPGAFNVGFNDSHMQATLPGGTPFNWGSDAAAANRGVGGTGAYDPAFTQHYYRPYASGGAASGPGGPTGDQIPAMLSDNEHVLTDADVSAMGGQGNVYAFRNALHRSGGGSIQWMDFIKQGQIPPLPPARGGKLGEQAGGRPDIRPGTGYPGVIGLPDWGTPGTDFGAPPSDWWGKPINPDDLLYPDWLPPQQRNEWKERQRRKRIKGFSGGGASDDGNFNPGMKIDLGQVSTSSAWDGLMGDLMFGRPSNMSDKPFWPPTVTRKYLPKDYINYLKMMYPGFAGGGEVDQQKLLQLIGKAATDSSGQGQGEQPDQGQGKPSDGNDLLRTEGYIPAAAGSTGVAGTSSLAGFLNLGNEAVGGLIDTGASLAQMAVSAAATAGTMGAGAAAGPAAGYGIQLAATEAKRGVSYGFQMASILGDAVIENLSPFGAPRWLGYDYTGFAPHLGIQQALTTTAEKAGGQAINQAFGLDPNGQKKTATGPVQPGQLPGALGGPQPLPGGEVGNAAGQPVGAPPAPGAAGGLPKPPTDPFGTNAPSTPNAAAGPTAQQPQQPQGGGGGFDPFSLLGIYDSGGILEPGQLAYNAGRTPEPVLTGRQWDAIGATASAPAERGGANYYITAADTDDAIRKLKRKERLDMSQYAGRP